VLRDFGWFPNGQAGNSCTNSPLDIIGLSTGVSLALSFALKHGNIANITHEHSGSTQSRIGTIVSLNGIHRSGYKDQTMLVDAMGRGQLPPVTATVELAKLSPHIKVGFKLIMFFQLLVYISTQQASPPTPFFPSFPAGVGDDSSARLGPSKVCFHGACFQNKGICL
jgi:hypothetical protein